MSVHFRAKFRLSHLRAGYGRSPWPASEKGSLELPPRGTLKIGAVHSARGLRSQVAWAHRVAGVAETHEVSQAFGIAAPHGVVEAGGLATWGHSAGTDGPGQDFMWTA